MGDPLLCQGGHGGGLLLLLQRVPPYRRHGIDIRAIAATGQRPLGHWGDDGAAISQQDVFDRAHQWIPAVKPVTAVAECARPVAAKAQRPYRLGRRMHTVKHHTRTFGRKNRLRVRTETPFKTTTTDEPVKITPASINMRAPALRYVEPRVSMTVASTTGLGQAHNAR